MEFSVLIYITGVLLAISAIFDYSYFSYYLQLNEYRIDRLRDFFSTEDGRAVMREYRVLWRTLFIAIAYPLLIDTVPAVWLLLVILLIDLSSKSYHVIKKTIRRPVPTNKIFLILGGAFTVEMLVFIFNTKLNIVLLFFAFRWAVILIIFALSYFPSMYIKRIYIHRATKKLATEKDLIIVGITGSYGKSSTKEFLSQILQTQFSVVKTPKNINTEIGIAKHILQTNFTNIDVYIVEMGAYRVGEIRAICNMVQPQIGILTAIAPQHLSLFGSMKHIQQAKYELLQALPTAGFAVTNVDNPYCRELLSTIQAQTRTFGSDDEYHPDVLIQAAKNTKHGIKFCVSANGNSREVEFPIFGKHNVFNVVPAAIVAKYLGMSRGDIDIAIKQITPGHGSITIHTYGKATLLNDSYNSNPEGFKAALDVLNIFPSDKKRIVITRGIKELGNKSTEIHEQIGGEIAFVADELILTHKESAEDLARGVVSKYNTTVSHMYQPQQVVQYLQELKQKNVVILLENRLHAQVREELHI